MTRDEAKAGMNVTKYGMSYSDEGSGSFSGHEDFIDKIYDDFEKEKLKIAENSLYRADKYNEVVDELIELKSRTCESCRYFKVSKLNENYCINDESMGFYAKYLLKDFGCNKWEAKDAK